MGQSCWNIYSVGSVSHLSSNTLNLFFLLIVTTSNWSGKAKLLTVFTSDSESSSVVSNSVILWNSPGQNTGVGGLSLLRGIFSTQGSNPGLPYCRGILYQLRHKGSPRILEWIAYPFSSRSSWFRNQTRVSCITGRFFTNWANREALTSDVWSLSP